MYIYIYHIHINIFYTFVNMYVRICIYIYVCKYIHAASLSSKFVWNNDLAYPLALPSAMAHKIPQVPDGVMHELQGARALCPVYHASGGRSCRKGNKCPQIHRVDTIDSRPQLFCQENKGVTTTSIRPDVGEQWCFMFICIINHGSLCGHSGISFFRC